MKIMSDREPTEDEILLRLDLYAKASYEGGILFVGQDTQGIAYESKQEPSLEYRLPSGICYSVPLGDTPAIYFAFELHSTLRYPEILETKLDDMFFNHFSIKVYDDFGAHIDMKNNADMDGIFKEVACWGVWELACNTEAGKVSNHFWGEIFLPRTSILEVFLERYRKGS